jgi:hypothetical protein
VNLLKKLLHINGGWQAFLLTVAEVAAVTAGYLILVVPPFTWPVFVAATFYAVLQATKIYDESPRLHPARRAPERRPVASVPVSPHEAEERLAP